MRKNYIFVGLLIAYPCVFFLGYALGHRRILSVGHPMVYRLDDTGEWKRGYVEEGDWVYWKDVN